MYRGDIFGKEVSVFGDGSAVFVASEYVRNSWLDELIKCSPRFCAVEDEMSGLSPWFG
jgi:hypothetical protein